MGHLQENIFNQQFFEAFYRYGTFELEEFYIDDEYFCTRVFFIDKHIREDYVVDATIGNIRVKKYVNSKWNYLNYISGNEYDFSKFIELFVSKITDEHEIRIIDPAPHEYKPLWSLKRNMNVSAKLIMIYEKKFGKYFIKDKAEEQVSLEPLLISRSEEIFNEFGISINELPFLKNGVVFIFPYENASILTWKVCKKEENWEGVRCRLDFKRFLHPFPEYQLECKLYDKQYNEFYCEKITIHDDDQIIFNIFPPQPISKEIYKVEAKLYEDGYLIDDHSGYPIRQIRIDTRLTGGGADDPN